MNRVKIEYGKAVVMGLCALAMLAICVLARTFDAVSLVIAFSALVFYFVLKARAFAQIRARGCGRVPRS